MNDAFIYVNLVGFYMTLVLVFIADIKIQWSCKQINACISAHFAYDSAISK